MLYHSNSPCYVPDFDDFPRISVNSWPISIILDALERYFDALSNYALRSDMHASDLLLGGRLRERGVKADKVRYCSSWDR